MTKRKHDSRYYKDLEIIQRAERLRGQGFYVDVVGSVDCMDCSLKWPLTMNDVEKAMLDPHYHEPGCKRKQAGGHQ